MDGLQQKVLEDCRSLITRAIMAREAGSDDNGHLMALVSDTTNHYTAIHMRYMVGALTRAVASTYDDLEDWSNHVLAALKDD